MGHATRHLRRPEVVWVCVVPRQADGDWLPAVVLVACAQLPFVVPAKRQHAAADRDCHAVPHAAADGRHPAGRSGASTMQPSQLEQQGDARLQQHRCTQLRGNAWPGAPVVGFQGDWVELSNLERPALHGVLGAWLHQVDVPKLAVPATGWHAHSVDYTVQ